MTAQTGNCPDCKAEILPDDNFCQDCGKSLTIAPSQPLRAAQAPAGVILTCLACGCRHDKLSSTCAGCGSLLKDVGVYTRDESWLKSDGQKAGLDEITVRPPVSSQMTSTYKVESPLLNRAGQDRLPAAGLDFFKRVPRVFIEGSVVVLLLGTFSIFFFSISKQPRADKTPGVEKPALTGSKKPTEKMVSKPESRKKSTGIHSEAPATVSKRVAIKKPEPVRKKAIAKQEARQAEKSTPRKIAAQPEKEVPAADRTENSPDSKPEAEDASEIETTRVVTEEPDKNEEAPRSPTRLPARAAFEEPAKIKPVQTAGKSGPAFKDEDMALYNRLLANYFTDGAMFNDRYGKPVEPPTFQEWLSKGKPNF